MDRTNSCPCLHKVDITGLAFRRSTESRAQPWGTRPNYDAKYKYQIVFSNCHVYEAPPAAKFIILCSGVSPRFQTKKSSRGVFPKADISQLS